MMSDMCLRFTREGSKICWQTNKKAVRRESRTALGGFG